MVQFDDDALAKHRRLIARLAAGESDALQVLYLEFSPLVHGIARRILEDPEDARETVQDTFIKLWRQAPSYRADRGEVVAWLVFIARHSAIDRVRQGARRRLLHEALQKNPPAASGSTTGSFEAQENLAHHLSQLSIAQRQALELAFFSDCTQAEIASAMQTPVGNVKNHLRRGLSKLRQMLTRHD